MHRYGFFAARDLCSNFAGIPVEASFRVYHNLEQVLVAIKVDRVPRYTVDNADDLRRICAPHE